jgi:hypothetical protein
MTTTTHSEISSATVSEQRAWRPARGIAVGLGLALAANFAILLVANLLLDGSVQVARPELPAESLTAAPLIMATLVNYAIGAVVLAGFVRVLGTARGIRSWTIAVAVFTAVSFGGPLSIAVPVASKLALVAMHVASALSAVLGQRLAARR